MKKIEIKSRATKDKSSIYKENKAFSILLGNGIRMSFTTEKDKNYAITEINRTLSSITFELNEIWIEGFAEYRRLWFYMASNTILSEEQKIMELHNEIYRTFNLVTNRSSWVNGNVFAFKFLFSIISCLVEQHLIYASIRKQKNQSVELKVMEMKIKNLNRIREELRLLTVEPKYARH